MCRAQNTVICLLSSRDRRQHTHKFWPFEGVARKNSVALAMVARLVALACVAAASASLCPQHIGPPCPRNYANDMADWDAALPRARAGLVVEPELAAFMNSSLRAYVARATAAFPPTRADSADVFEGVAGRALMCLRLFERFGERAHLELALAYAEAAVGRVGSLGADYAAAHNWGPAGVWSVAAAARLRAGDAAGAEAAAAEVVSVARGAPRSRG